MARDRVQRRMSAISLVVAVVALATASCSGPATDHLAHAATTSVTPSGTDVGNADCATLSPASSDDVPATLQPTDQQQHWWGTGCLWIAAPSTMHPSPRPAHRGYRLKYGSVTLNEHGRMTGSAGPPTLTATLRGATARVHGSTGGYSLAAGPAGHPLGFWPTTINLPRAGCWQLTETFRDTTLRFRIQIGNQAQANQCKGAATGP